MGKDKHEEAKWRDAVDRNPNSPGTYEDRHPEGQQIPLWVQKKIQTSVQKKWRAAAAQVSAIAKWRYLNA